MQHKKQHPSYWLLYLSLPLMIGLFVLEMRLSLSEPSHRFVEIMIVLIVYGSISLWLKANKGAMVWEDLERSEFKTTTVASRGPILRRLAGWASAIAVFFFH
jgi:hypothetical protein